MTKAPSTATKTKAKSKASKSQAISPQQRMNDLTADFVREFFEVWKAYAPNASAVEGLATMKESLVFFSTLRINQDEGVHVCSSSADMAKHCALLTAISEVWSPAVQEFKTVFDTELAKHTNYAG